MTSLTVHLQEHARVSDDLRHVILTIAEAAKYIQRALRTTEAGLTGVENQFGEKQLKLDAVSDDIIRSHLQESGLVASFISEEQPEIIEIDPALPYSVVYDPLDGSSLVEVDFAIGSIFGIYEGGELIGKCPRDQVSAIYILYGPRTVLVYAAKNGVHEFVLSDVGEFMLLRENLGVADDAKNYSPGNLRAVNENEGYAKLMQTWLKEELTLRYSGCMVADVHHIIAKGQGIFTNVGGKKYPEGKLRLVFECGPFAYLMDQAGGDSSDGKQSILDKKITSTDQRTPILIGSKNEVARCRKFLGRA